MKYYRILHIFTYWLAACIIMSGYWLSKTFGSINTDQILVTLSFGVSDVMPELILSGFKWIIVSPTLLLFLIITSEYLLRKSKIFLSIIPMTMIVVLALILAGKSITARSSNILWDDTFDSYSTPKSSEVVPISLKTHNIIWIFVESLEGGYTDQKILKELNIATDFMDSLEVTPLINKYTIGAIMSARCAAPLFLATFLNPNQYTTSAFKKAICIDDILRNAGYSSELIMGTNAKFSGLGEYFKLHASAKIFDKEYLDRAGIVKHGVFDSYPDEDVFSFALNRLENANKQVPFSMTIVTIDNHAPSGFPSNECKKNYGEKMNEILLCNNNMLAKFIKNIKSSNLLENTTLIIVGDHPFMGRFPELLNDRQIFAKIYSPTKKVKRHTVSPFDFLPGVLSGSGFSIDKNIYGLGYSFYDVDTYPTENWGKKLEHGFEGFPTNKYIELHQ